MDGFFAGPQLPNDIEQVITKIIFKLSEIYGQLNNRSGMTLWIDNVIIYSRHTQTVATYLAFTPYYCTVHCLFLALLLPWTLLIDTDQCWPGTPHKSFGDAMT